MGAYLSAPLTEKESTDEANDYLACGASQMQGWRMSQEDAHICALNFDINTSLFAVFDGHGGSEVALYCSQKLPEFLKNVNAYKKGEFEQALKDAFIGFDATLVNDDVIEELKKLIPDDKVDETDTDEEADEDEENIHELCNEGRMPLNELLEKLKDPQMAKIKAGESSGTSKPLSPFLRGRRNGSSSSSGSGSVRGSGSGSGSATVENGECSSASDSTIQPRKLDSTEEEAVSSSSASVEKKAEPANSVSNGPSSGNGPSSTEGASSSEPNERNSCNSPDSSSTANKTADDESKNQKETSSSSSLDDSDESEHDEEEEEVEDESGVVLQEDEADTEDDEESEDQDHEEYEEDETFLNGMFEGIKRPGSSSGCTAVVALLHENELFVANAGDSRCVVCRDGKAMDMSFDHKPEDTEELERIRKAGGRVTMDGRVNGGLNLSRAIGDHAYKTNKDLKPEEQMISALPDVKRVKLSPKDEFMILACDGIWNSLSSDEVVDFVRTRIQRGETKMSAICEELFTTCLAPNTCGDGTGCDNMTAVIIQFQPLLTERFQSQDICADEVITSKKRQASPTSNNDELTTGSSKRIKTDDKIEADE
ncbi:probable protein phosphatase CG10417 isoform X2 [Sitodiplosis mosellana]|uniref:probable protein phosphatase CG10417 isoform X2 n=1 Tax=Sitodiplosis mosellana TaxID=263140 RepID=UPI002445305A|nr:probable protein phosphatase CG10417 isoform X2 [Sitodiplosis mosellana]XP_055319393.1 probable protein phosphatase CG10417 isoform X2 [Sitodiplosis mosellana]